MLNPVPLLAGIIGGQWVDDWGRWWNCKFHRQYTCHLADRLHLLTAAWAFVGNLAGKYMNAKILLTHPWLPQIHDIHVITCLAKISEPPSLQAPSILSQNCQHRTTNGRLLNLPFVYLPSHKSWSHWWIQGGTLPSGCNSWPLWSWQWCIYSWRP